jgi:hypothetical protein
VVASLDRALANYVQLIQRVSSGDQLRTDDEIVTEMVSILRLSPRGEMTLKTRAEGDFWVIEILQQVPH